MRGTTTAASAPGALPVNVFADILTHWTKVQWLRHGEQIIRLHRLDGPDTLSSEAPTIWLPRSTGRGSCLVAAVIDILNLALWLFVAIAGLIVLAPLIREHWDV